MISTALKFLVAFVMLFLIFGIFVQHLFSKPQDFKKFICKDDKLLSLVDEQASVYTQVESLSCNDAEGMLNVRDEKKRFAYIEH